MGTNLADELILDFHLPAELAPYLPKRELVVGVNEAVQPYHVEVVLVLFRHIENDRFDHLKRRPMLDLRDASLTTTQADVP